MVDFQASVRDFCVLRLCLLLLTNFIYPVRPTCLSRFMGHTISSSSYRPPISRIQHRVTTLFISPTPHILSRHGKSSTWTLPPPSTRRPLTLVSAPLVVCLLLPLCPASVRPPLPPSACSQVPVGTWGVFFRWSLRLLCVPASLPSRMILPLLSSSGVWFLLGWNFSRAKARGTGASTPWHFLAPVLSLPRYLVILSSFKLPGSAPPSPLSLPPYLIYPVPAAEVCGE